MAKRLDFGSMLLGGTLLALLGAGAFGGYMFLSRPAIEISKVAFTFDPVTLNGVLEVTIHGHGSLRILNVTLTAHGNLYSNLNPHISFPFTVELPVKFSLNIFEHHYLPPVPSAITVTIQGAWTHQGLSFPITISETAPLKWCVLYESPQPYPYCWTNTS